MCIFIIVTVITFYYSSVGRVRVTSPLTVTEDDTSFEIVIAVAEGIILLERELVYGVQLLADTAEGRFTMHYSLWL